MEFVVVAIIAATGKISYQYRSFDMVIHEMRWSERVSLFDYMKIMPMFTKLLQIFKLIFIHLRLK